MSTTWTKIGIEEISGTSRRGEIKTTWDEIEAVFGPASHENIDGSDTESDVVAEWDLKFSDGTIATIYFLGEDDEAEDSLNGWWAPRRDERVTWEVGGTLDGKPVSLVKAALKR